VNKVPVISLVLNAHAPWVRSSCFEEQFFESVSETYLPLLETFDRLDADHVPFHLGIVLSPSLCYLLSDEGVLQKYTASVNRRLEFGYREIGRTAALPAINRLARQYYEEAIDRQALFIGRYEKSILNVLERYQEKGNVELIGTAATAAFLPFYISYPEAVQAQIETATAAYQRFFGKCPIGFWLPELGFAPELDRFLRAYNFGYMICESHALVLGNPPPAKGTFFPVKTPAGVLVMARDFYADKNITGEGAAFSHTGCYRDNARDVGYELSREALETFLGERRGRRCSTGYKYWTRDKQVYEAETAKEDAQRQAGAFLKTLVAHLSEVSSYMNETPVSLCAYDADVFGRCWYEGPAFIEALFREAAAGGIQCASPGEYLYDQDVSHIQTLTPAFSSAGVNGYAETWLGSSNDWVYRHMIRAVERMTELAERFPNESGIKERALNQAAREMLLSQDSTWPAALYRQESPECARKQIEDSLRNFTTIYESLGSGHISTDWLTRLERSHRVFPAINYRTFRRKR
jgi:1,4-alpha-glucan branching enzyme